MDDQGEDDNIFQVLLDDSESRQQANLSKSHKTHIASGGFQISIQPQLIPDSSADSSEDLHSYLNSKGWAVLADFQDEKFHYVLVNKNNFVSVQVYRVPRQNFKSDRSVPHPDQYHSFNTQLSSSLFQDDVCQGKKTSTFLFLMQQDNSVGKSHHNERKDKLCTRRRGGSIALQHSLFVYLFGQDTACINSPVLLLCCNNGDIFSYIMKSENSGKLQLFCSVHGPAIALVSVSLAEENPADEQDKVKSKIQETLRVSLGPRLSEASKFEHSSKDGLLVVGSSGESCLFVQPPSPGFTIPALFLLPDPVLSCVAIGKHIIYSTGTLVKTCQPTLCQRENQTFISLTSHANLCQANVIDLRVQDLEETQEWHIVGITSSYDMMTVAVLNKTASSSSQKPAIEFEFNFQSSLGEEDQRDKPACLKDTLKALNAHGEAIKALQKKSHLLDSSLHQLNLFATISQEQKLSKLTKSKESDTQGSSADCLGSVVCCKCDLIGSDDKRPDGWNLRVKLSNKSASSFSDQWSVLVTVNPVYVCSLNLIHTPSSTMVDSFQFRLQNGMEPRSDAVFAVPVLKTFGFDYLLGLEVSVSLVLCMAPIHGDSFSAETQTQEVMHRLMEVEIYRHVFDSIDFLGKTSSNQENVNCFSQGKIEDVDWLEKQLKKMAGSRLGGCNNEIPGHSESEMPSFSVEINLPLYYDSIVATSISSDVKEKGITSSADVIESVFGFKPELESDISCHLLSPNLEVVSLTINTRDSKDRQLQKEDMSNFSVTVKACDVLLMFTVFQAIVKRTQRTKPQRAESALSRQKLESLLQDSKCLRNSMREIFQKFKFESQLSAEHQNMFCYFLSNLQEIRELEVATL